MTREEAIEKVRRMSLPKETMEILEALAPELRESEDERIRKWLVDYFAGIGENWIHREFTCKQIVAYLEKQKDKVSFVDNDTQKSLAEEFREADPRQKQDYSGLNDLERAIHRGFLAAGVENVSIEIVKETAKECLAQMKPAEWSEEDEKMLRTIISDGSRGVELDSKQISWLRSLRPSWKPSEEHLSALLAVFNDPNNIGSQTCQLALTDLYKQLKKMI